MAGEAILASDSAMPQIAVGLEFKQLESSGLTGTLKALGADKSGTDVYISATKLLLAQGIVLNGTLRATKANQNACWALAARWAHRTTATSCGRSFSVAWLLSRHVAIGGEYRAMTNNLQGRRPRRRPGRRSARRRLERPVRRLGAEQEPVADAGLCGPGADRAGHHGQPAADRRLPVGAVRFLVRSPPQLTRALQVRVA